MTSIGSTYAYILHSAGQARLSVVARSNLRMVKERVSLSLHMQLQLTKAKKGLSIRSEKFGNHDKVMFKGGASDRSDLSLVCVSYINYQFILTAWKHQDQETRINMVSKTSLIRSATLN